MRARWLRYWHTLRWLRPVQFYGRAWFRLYRPRPDLRPAPMPAPAPATPWQRCARAPSMTGPASFRFLSVEHQLLEASDWNHAEWPKLWLYNAHYFDDLVADGAATRVDWHRALIARWIAENAPGQGNGKVAQHGRALHRQLARRHQHQGTHRARLRVGRLHEALEQG